MNRIRELRKKNKISAKKLAEMLNITVRHLYDLETGKVQLTEDRIKFLCNKFGVTSDYLLGLSDNPYLNEITNSETMKELEEIKAEIEKLSDRFIKAVEKQLVKQEQRPS